jgi:excisionase family DNA binding protein
MPIVDDADPPRSKAAQVRAARARHQLERAKGRLLSLPAAADYAGLPYTTLRNAVARGLLPAVRIPGGRGLWIDRRALDQALEAWTERGA